MNDIIELAFIDELEKIAGAKRYLRLQKAFYRKLDKGKADWDDPLSKAVDRSRAKYERRVAGKNTVEAVDRMIEAIGGAAPAKNLRNPAVRKELKHLPKGFFRQMRYMRRVGAPMSADIPTTARAAIKAGPKR